jgi:hypothetical protein
MAKLSMVLLVALAPLVIAAAAARHRRVRSAFGHVAVLLVLVYGVTLATSWFEIGRLNDGVVNSIAQDPRYPFWLKAGAEVFRWIPVPKAYWLGVRSLVGSDHGGNPVYLLGEYQPWGSSFYFLVAAAVKFSLALQLLALAGLGWLIFLVTRRRISPSVLIFLAVPPLLYAGLASMSTIQLGVRLILPAVPFLAALAAFSFREENGRAMRAAGAALLVLLAVQTARIYPDGISFFNIPSGGPQNGLRYLVDSNLDWGQDLPDLAEWIRANNAHHVRLFYFGTDKPSRLMGDDEIEMKLPPWGPEWVESNPYEPEPGYYAVSATLLPGHFFAEEYRDYFKKFREATPIAKAGYSIFIYKFDDSPAVRSERDKPTPTAARHVN